MKKVIACLTSVVLALGLMPLPAFAGDEAGSPLAVAAFELGELVAHGSAADKAELEAQALDVQGLETQGASKSGITSLPAPTADQISAAWKAIPEQPEGMAIFKTANDNDAYTPAVLTDGAYAYAKAYLNFIRYQAGLSTVSFDATLNASAAQGALILARLNGSLSHFPSTPDGITDAQAKPGKYACATSNLSYGASYPSLPNALPDAIQGQVDDDSGSNLSTLGHRRWLLNPTLSTAGIGCASATSSPRNKMFTAVRVFDNPYNENYDASYGAVGEAGATGYDFVAWPASGAFANNVFAVGTPWSISLNEGTYKDPVASNVTVTVRRASDGASWTMTSADSQPSTSAKYLIVENSGYGVSNCIIFNPGSGNVGQKAYSDSYSVTVTGLETRSGQAATLSYDVDFFDADSASDDGGDTDGGAGDGGAGDGDTDGSAGDGDPGSGGGAGDGDSGSGEVSAASGTCGANVSWSLDASGVLTVSGTGAMNDYSTVSNYNTGITTDVPWGDRLGSIKSAVIRSGVTSIGNCAFSDCPNLSSVSIASSVKSVGESAFARCTSLQSLNLPSGLTSLGASAFVGCTKLAALTIPSGVKAIGRDLCSACSSLSSVTMPEGVESIEQGAFKVCTALTNVKLPDSLRSIGMGAFFGCKKLTSVDIPFNVDSIESQTFQDCSGLTRVNIYSPTLVVGTSNVFPAGAALYCVANSVTSECLAYQSLDYKALEGLGTPLGALASNTTVAYTESGVQAPAVQVSASGQVNKVLYSTRDYLWRGSKAYTLEPPVFKEPGQHVVNYWVFSLGREARLGSYTVTVTQAQGSLAFEKDAVEVAVGGVVSNPLTVSTDLPVMYESSDVAVASVDGSGKVTALKEGTCTITASAKSGNYTAATASYKLSVSGKEGPIKVKAQPRGAEGVLGSYVTLTAECEGTGLRYDWRFSTDGVVPDDTYRLTNSTSATLKVFVDADAEKRTYWCHVTDSLGNAVNTAAATVSIARKGGCIAYGVDGESVTWELSNDGTLSIRGTGALTTCAWGGYASQVSSISVGEGITTIPDMAFYQCACRSVKLPSTLRTIGEEAFSGSSLRSVVIPEGVTTIGLAAFAQCLLLEQAVVPSTVVNVGDAAFNRMGGGSVYAVTQRVYNLLSGTGSGGYPYVSGASLKLYGDLSDGGTIAAIPDQAYTGSKATPPVRVEYLGKTLVNGADYTVSYADNVNAGTASVTVVGKGSYTGTTSATFTIAKASNAMKVSTAAKAAKAAKLKKKALKVRPIAVKSAHGKVAFAKVSGSAKLSVKKSTGKVTVRKGTKKGAYTMWVRVSASGDANHKSASKVVKVTVRVK